MKVKRIVWIGLWVVFAAGMLAGGTYYLMTRDPTPARIDTRVYEDYVGYYAFRTGSPLTIRREGNRLLSIVPEHSPTELFPQTETQFFIKGNPARLIFHRDTAGRVDYAISRWKTIDEIAQKRAALPANPEGTNGLIAATTAGKALEAGLAGLKEGGSAAAA